MRIPIIDLELNRPTKSSLAWYGGIGAMAGVGLVEWPLAAGIVGRTPDLGELGFA